MGKHRLEEENIKIGHTYRGTRGPVRYVLWVSADSTAVQYDSDAIGNGRHYPKTRMSAFLNWAIEDVTPKDEKDV